MAGSGNCDTALRKLAGDLGIGGNVKWLGDVDKSNVIQLYREADVSLLLSASENFGTVVAESVAAGTPAIVTTNSGLAEFVNEPGCNGIAYPPDTGNLARGRGGIRTHIQEFDELVAHNYR